MTTATDFDLTGLVREVLDGADNPTASSVTEAVYRRIPVEHHAAVLRQVLRLFVSQVMNQERRRVMNRPATRPVSAPQSSETHPPPKSSKAKQRKTPDAGEYDSHYTAQVNQHYEKLMRVVLSVGTRKDEQKMFGEFNAADLRAAQEIRRSNARSNTIAADKLAATEEALTAHSVRLVKDLPKDVILDIYPDGEVR